MSNARQRSLKVLLEQNSLERLLRETITAWVTMLGGVVLFVVCALVLSTFVADRSEVVVFSLIPVAILIGASFTILYGYTLAAQTQHTFWRPKLQAPRTGSAHFSTAAQQPTKAAEPDKVDTAQLLERVNALESHQRDAARPRDTGALEVALQGALEIMTSDQRERFLHWLDTYGQQQSRGASRSSK